MHASVRLACERRLDAARDGRGGWLVDDVVRVRRARCAGRPLRSHLGHRDLGEITSASLGAGHVEGLSTVTQGHAWSMDTLDGL